MLPTSKQTQQSTLSNPRPRVLHPQKQPHKNNKKGHLFYWFMEALNPSNDPPSIPLLIWLNGGPGASSLYGLMAENGMYHLNDDLTITLKDSGLTWSNKYHMLFVDNPSSPSPPLPSSALQHTLLLLRCHQSAQVILIAIPTVT